MKKPEDMGLGWVLAVLIAIAVIGGYVVVRYWFIPRRARRMMIFCRSNLRHIYSAKEQWSIEYGGTNGQVIGWVEVGEYIRGGATKVFCPCAPIMNPTNCYEVHAIGTDPECKIVTSGKYRHEL